MFREVFFNKWILGGYALAIVFGIGCYFWYQHQLAPNRHDTAETAEVVRKWESAQKANSNNTPQGEASTLVDSTTSTEEKLITDTTPVTKNTEPSQAQNKIESPTKTSKSAKVRVSPHGFGPYPKVPEGLFKEDPSRVFECSPGVELIRRVRIKLFEQGIITTGGTRDHKTGLIYPTVKGEVYVSWGYGNIPGLGKQRYAVDIGGSRETMERIRNNVRKRESPLPVEMRQITEQDIPSDVVVKSRRSGIDPYKFLNLKKP